MRPLEEYQDGDVIEPDQWRNPEATVFSHQGLVMSGLKQCMTNGSVELREGYWNEKTDKFGNIHRSYVEDTRKKFIESVKSLMMVMVCDFDEEATKKIKTLLARLKERKEFWLSQEWSWWESLNNNQKQSMYQLGKGVIKGYFNKKLDYDNNYFEEEVEIFREICTELNNLTARHDFYGDVIWTG